MTQVIVLQHKKKKQDVILTNGTKIKIFKKDSAQSVTGALLIKNDSSIIVNNQLIQLSQISAIYFNFKINKSKGTVFFASGLMTSGLGAGIVATSINFLRSNSSYTEGYALRYVGLAIESGLRIAGILMSIKGLRILNYSARYGTDKWFYTVENYHEIVPKPLLN